MSFVAITKADTYVDQFSMAQQDFTDRTYLADSFLQASGKQSGGILDQGHRQIREFHLTRVHKLVYR